MLDDRRTIKDYWLAITLIYVGCELVSITPRLRDFEFVIICPELDYAEYYNEFHAGQSQIADAKAFGKVATQIGTIVRDAKRNGEAYINEDYRQVLRDEVREKQS